MEKELTQRLEATEIEMKNRVNELIVERTEISQKLEDTTRGNSCGVDEYSS